METTGGLGKEIRGLVIGKLGICVCWHPVWWLDFCGNAGKWGQILW